MRKAGRIRKKGGGRKQIIAKDETLRADLEDLLEPKGEQPRLLRWTTKSMSKLKEALGARDTRLARPPSGSS